ncbi:MAG: nuclear transport factor 2 family protein [Tepidisphaeraceae bacterium]
MTVNEWLDEFAANVRARDYGRARKQFIEGVFAFGSLATVMIGLDSLEMRQWRPIWERTRDFTFQHIRIETNAFNSIVMARWSSWCVDTEAIHAGRATIVLRRENDRWIATHTHFSLNPGDA